MRSSYCITTAMLWGTEARAVKVEVSIASGLPGIDIVGRPDSSVAESRSRVRCALRNAGFSLPRDAVTVNLAPADLRKTGTAFDLPIALGILAASGQIPTDGLQDCLVMGELSLEGAVMPVKGFLAYARLAMDLGLTLIAPAGSTYSAAFAPQGRFVGELGQFRDGSLAGIPIDPAPRAPSSDAMKEKDFGEVAGQVAAKRALTIAAAGQLGILMIGPPGVGKTMLASRMPSILPPMDSREQMETELIHSLVDSADPDVRLGRRSFRAPHHSATLPGLIGGGNPVRPGEISLAHNGVLFMDELGEFNKGVLQALRQPMEEHRVRITRAEGSYEFPCRFQLVAASNPCPCGYLGDRQGHCSCSEAQVQGYRAKLSGPIMDRIDLLVTLERPRAGELMGPGTGGDSASMRSLVCEAREFRAWRYAHVDGDVDAGIGMGSVTGVERAMRRAGLDDATYDLLGEFVEKSILSVRSLMSLLRIARTIADMERSELVRSDHALEAHAFRSTGIG